MQHPHNHVCVDALVFNPLEKFLYEIGKKVR